MSEQGEYGAALSKTLDWHEVMGDPTDYADFQDTIELARTELANLLKIREAAQALLPKLTDELTGPPKNIAKSHWAFDWNELEAALAATKVTHES